MSFKYNNFMGGLGLSSSNDRAQFEQSRGQQNNQILGFQSINSISNRQNNQNVFNIKEMRSGSRGSQRQIQQQEGLLASSKLNGGNGNTVAIMQYRNRGRSIQSAGKPPMYQGPLYAGQLPTLGLNRYKNVEIKNGENQKNPFSIQKETEKLLIARERERENKDFNRMQSDGLRVFQKNIQTRQNRAGVIREINDIKPSKNGKGNGNDQLMLMNASYEEQQVQQNKKLNIFDENDSSLIKHETLAKLGLETRGAIVSAVDEESDNKSLRSQQSSVMQLAAAQKPKALEYLQKGRDQKESTRDFILNARNILIAQIAINDKTEETERLKEYIIMEKEKLEEAKKTFDEDKDKFQKYMEDLNRKAVDTAADVQRLTNEKNEKMERIQQLQIKIQKKKSKIKQIDEKLVVYKQHKAFLDMLAISAGKKQDKRSHSHGQGQDSAGLVVRKDGRAESTGKVLRPLKKENTGHAAGTPGFFLTQTNQPGHKHKNSIDKQEDLDQDGQTIDEDDDFQIYFDKYTLLEHLSHLEEDNLFKIHLVQEDEQALDKLRRSIDLKIMTKEQEIKDVNNNIDMLIASKNLLLTKQSFLDTNMRVKQSSTTHPQQTGFGHNSNFRQNLGEGRGLNNSMDQTIGMHESSSERNNALFMLQQLTGCSKEQMNKLNYLIGALLEKAGIKQEDQSDKIEMLRKIEQRLNFLAEAREYISMGNKRKDLEEKEKELHILRKEQNIQRKKNKEIQLQEERQIKNMERIRKQEKFVIFKGRKDMHRGRKPDLKPKEKTDDTPNQEVVDQLRYLGSNLQANSQ